MTKAEAIRLFGGVVALARAVEVTSQAVSQWPDGEIDEPRRSQVILLAIQHGLMPPIGPEELAANASATMHLPIQQAWSNKVKALMVEKGITQEALAPVLKVKTRGAVGHILTGRRQMSAHQLMALARYFDVTVEDLFGDEEPDFDAIRLARAIESLSADARAHLHAVADAFVNRTC